MSEKRKILTVISVLRGGGAERVSSMLTNEFNESGYETEYLLTSSDEDEIINRDLNQDIPITVLRKLFESENALQKLFYKLLRIVSSVACRLFEAVKKDVPVCFSYLSFISEYRREIKAMREKLKNEPDTTVVVFLQPSIPIVLLAARGLPNKIIISERGDPKRLIKSRYGYKFIEKYYARADSAVFQTEDAKNTYPANISAKGKVIFNPINGSLPESYSGERNKYITTFCRISKQKNLPMLINAFNIVHKRFPEYILRIIGQTSNKDDEEALIETKALIEKYGLTDFVEFLPFSPSVHKKIITDALYVNSSDYEGMSNAMLEAMAIGMPVVCTDCPIGGAAAVIKHKENGMLTKVCDHEDFAMAVIEVLENSVLSQKLSVNAAKIREELSLKNIAKQWMELF
ncbi:MAG: glycosyltransferase [Clostridia bacterium]|nr:glycosyltransferase [Clostridia bacterium]